MTGSQTMRAGNATSLAVSSRCAAPPLRCGPSGDTTSAAANGLATTGRVLPVVTDRPFHTTTAGALTMPLTSSVGVAPFTRAITQSEYTSRSVPGTPPGSPEGPRTRRDRKRRPLIATLRLLTQHGPGSVPGHRGRYREASAAWPGKAWAPRSMTHRESGRPAGAFAAGVMTGCFQCRNHRVAITVYVSWATKHPPRAILRQCPAISVRDRPSVDQVGAELGHLTCADLIRPLVQLVLLPKHLAEFEVLQHDVPLTSLEQFLCQAHVRTKRRE